MNNDNLQHLIDAYDKIKHLIDAIEHRDLTPEELREVQKILEEVQLSGKTR